MGMISNLGHNRYMDEVKVYLDTCCYNRPFDIQDNDKIIRETKAKLYIQSLIKFKSLILVTSFVLSEEVSKINAPYKKNNVADFITNYGNVYVTANEIDKVKSLASGIMQTGIKTYDAMHVACAIYAGCDYFITTDKRLLNYKSERINLLNPIEFMGIWEGNNELR
jgi:predicted nucleic acid-binding protein